MSRFDDSDLDFSDELRPNATCDDCGIDFSRAKHDPGGWCDACCALREAWADAYEIRMAKATLPNSVSLAKEVPVVVEVALVPKERHNNAIVIDVALVPVVKQSGQVDEKLIFEDLVAQRDVSDLKRMAKAILSADLSTIREVA